MDYEQNDDGVATMDAPGGTQPPGTPDVAEDADDFDPDLQRDLIASFDDDWLDALCGVAYAAMFDPGVDVDDDTADALQAVTDDMPDDAKGIMARAAAGDEATYRAADAERRLRDQSGPGVRLEKIIASLPDDKLDALRVACEAADGAIPSELPDADTENQFNDVLARLSPRERALFKAGGAGARTIREMAYKEQFARDHADPTPTRGVDWSGNAE